MAPMRQLVIRRAPVDVEHLQAAARAAAAFRIDGDDAHKQMAQVVDIAAKGRTCKAGGAQVVDMARWARKRRNKGRQPEQSPTGGSSLDFPDDIA